MKQFKGLISILIFLMLLTSCASSRTSSNEIVSMHNIPAKSDKLNSEFLHIKSESKENSSVSDYKIGPEDLIELNVFGVNELNTLVRVSATGYIKLPLIDKMEVAGLTTSELETLISKKLDKYVTSPVVSVYIKEYRSQQIAVLGAVKSPGVYNVTKQRYLIDLLLMAGGLNQDAGDICIIQRQKPLGVSNGDEQPIEQIVIDLNELLVTGRIELNVPVSSGDIVHVPKSGIFFVDGAVKSPGSFPVTGKTTITQVISMAKGVAYESSLSDIHIYRDNGKPERDVITIDYNSVLKRKSPDVAIKDKDIIIVSTSGYKKFVKGIVGTLNFGFFSLGKGFGN